MKESKAPSLGRTPAQKFFDKWQGLFYLIPWIIGFVVFKAIPFGQSLYYSFTDMNFFKGIHEYGLMNYADRVHQCQDHQGTDHHVQVQRSSPCP